MDDDIEAKLLAMLKEPTAEKVRRDQVRAELLMRARGRAFELKINAMLADLADKIVAAEGTSHDVL